MAAGVNKAGLAHFQNGELTATTWTGGEKASNRNSALTPLPRLRCPAKSKTSDNSKNGLYNAAGRSGKIPPQS